MKKRKLKKSVKGCLILVVMGLFLIATSIIYCYLVSPVDINDNKDIEVNIKQGMHTRDIGKLLKEKDLIKSYSFFLLYGKLNNCSSLKAAKYNVKKSMSLEEIYDDICKGNAANESINLTFKEGKRITDYAELISKETNISKEDFLNTVNNKTYLKELINKYWFLNNDILNENIYYPLEGYLFPDTYNFKSKDITSEEIIEKLLEEEGNVLSKYKSKILDGKHTIHEYITLASMAELEGTNLENRKGIISVFENRLKIGMNLGSDVTTYYAEGKSMSEPLDAKAFNNLNSYNTRNKSFKTLPVGPIASVSKESIEATLYYDPSDYYYFVADSNKKIYFTKTGTEHEALVTKLKKEGKWLW